MDDMQHLHPRSRRHCLLALSGLALAGCGGSGGEPPPSGEIVAIGLPANASVWQRELQELVNLLLAYHPRPFAHLPRATFLEQARALMAALPGRSDEQAYLSLMLLLARIRDGHSFLQFPWKLAPYPTVLPIAVFAFEEGLFVTGWDAEQPELAALAGAQVLAYGAKPAAQALQEAATYMPAENPQMALHYGAQVLRSGLVLAQAGLSAAPDRVRLSLRRRDGLVIEQVLMAGTRFVELQSAFSGAPARYARHPELDFWAEWLGDTVFYLRYLRCRDAPGFEALVRTHLSQPRFAGLRRVIVDLRGNSGGDSRVVAPLVEGLRLLGFSGSRIAVLSDRGTLSAAVDAILDLKALGALHAGEAPGQRPNFCGNVKQLASSSGRLSINLPTTYQPRVAGDPDQLTPELQRPWRFADWQLQADPWLDEVLTA